MHVVNGMRLYTGRVAVPGCFVGGVKEVGGSDLHPSQATDCVPTHDVDGLTNERTCVFFSARPDGCWARRLVMKENSDSDSSLGR